MDNVQLRDIAKQPEQQTVYIEADGDGFQDQPDVGKGYDPSHDRRDMYRVGKRQQLKRRFKYCKPMFFPYPF